MGTKLLNRKRVLPFFLLFFPPGKPLKDQLAKHQARSSLMKFLMEV